MIKHVLLWSLLVFGSGPLWAQAADDRLHLGHWSVAGIDRLLEEKGAFSQPGDQIAVLSDAFVGTPYLANSLVGGPAQKEQLVVRFDGFDCMTLIESVEALRQARTFHEFTHHLKQVRYRAGVVDYTQRNHFFSDWAVSGAVTVQDVTEQVGQTQLPCVDKMLNRRSDGQLYLEGIPTQRRRVCHLPAQNINNDTLAALKSGDYVGFYSDLPGLDVSHTGIIVKREGRVLLRHASSAENVNRVVDVDLLSYLKGRAGLIILRPVSE